MSFLNELDKCIKIAIAHELKMEEAAALRVVFEAIRSEDFLNEIEIHPKISNYSYKPYRVMEELKEKIQSLEKKLARAVEENKILREVAEFYGDKENWDKEYLKKWDSDSPDEYVDLNCWAHGNRARQALEEIKGMV